MSAGASGATPTFLLFGGVGARAGDGSAADVGGPKQQAVLALLLLEPGRVVALDRIVDVLWDDDPPSRPEASVRGYVSNLRRALDGGATIGWRHGGYVIDADPDDVDLHRFERLVDRGDRALRAGRLTEAADAAARRVGAAALVARSARSPTTGRSPPSPCASTSVPRSSTSCRPTSVWRPVSHRDSSPR